jgi:Zn-dependent peptidase ImmA (M78 family)
MARPISVAALSQIEAGKARPSRETIDGLANALALPPGYFTANWPSSSREPLTFFRNLKSTSTRERRRAAALAITLHDFVSAMELYVRLPNFDVQPDRVGPNGTIRDVESAAESIRLEWGLSFEPIPNMVRELERHGVPVARMPLGHRLIDAFTIYLTNRAIVVLTDDKQSYVRSRFDAAHELGHIVMHAGEKSIQPWMEAQAQDFASCFLFPRAVAERELPDRLDAGGWTRLAELKRKWGISIAALLYRANRLQVMTDDRYRNAMRHMAMKGWRTLEPGDKELGLPEAPSLIESALKKVEMESGLSFDEFVLSAGLPLDEATNLVRATIDRRPSVDV